MKAVAYLRKSTSGVDGNGVERQEGSFDRQRASILDYAKRRGIQVLKWYEEPVSGKSIRKRKVFLQMIKDAKSIGRPFQAIIFGEYDRYMRDVKEAMRYEVELDDAGIELHFTNLKNDGSSGDEIYKAVARNMAAEYSRELARKTIQGMYRKAKLGSWLGGIAPYGYRAIRDERGFGMLEIHKEEAAIVKEIFALAGKGWGHKRVATYLNKKGIPSSEAARKRNELSRNRNVDGRWPAGTIAAMLKNPVYKGLYRWNKKARVDCFDWKLEGQGTVEIGRIRSGLEQFKHSEGVYVDRSKPASEWVIKDKAVPAIIEPDVFDKLQGRFQKRGTWERGNYVKYLMAGGLKCASCGNRCFGHRYGKTLKETGKRAFYEYYRCSGDVSRGTHARSAQPMIKRQAIDDVVVAGILKRAENFVNFSNVQTLFRNRVKEYLDSAPDRLADVDRTLEKLRREIDKLAEAYSKFDRSIPEERVRELNAHKRALENERRDLIAAGNGRTTFGAEKEAEQFFSQARDARTILESGNAHDRIRLRERFLHSAEIDWKSSGTMVKLSWRWAPLVYCANETARLHHIGDERRKIKEKRRVWNGKKSKRASIFDPE